MKLQRKLTGSDAIRLLCNTVQKVHHADRYGQDVSPLCYDTGEFILQDALEHLAHGDTDNAKALIALFEEWRRTGVAPAPYCHLTDGLMDDGIPF